MGNEKKQKKPVKIPKKYLRRGDPNKGRNKSSIAGSHSVTF